MIIKRHCILFRVNPKPSILCAILYFELVCVLTDVISCSVLGITTSYCSGMSIKTLHKTTSCDMNAVAAGLKRGLRHF